MNRHRVAIAVDEDGKTIPRRMLGQAHAFLIVDLDATTTKGKELARSLRLNPYKTTLQRGKTYDVADVLSDCQTIICRYIGKRGIPRMKARGFELIFTQCATADDALAEFIEDHFGHVSQAVRENGRDNLDAERTPNHPG